MWQSGLLILWYRCKVWTLGHTRVMISANWVISANEHNLIDGGVHLRWLLEHFAKVFCCNAGFGTNPALNEMYLQGHRQPYVHAAPSLSELKWGEAAAAMATLWSWRNEPFHLFPLTRRRWFHPQLETLRPCCPVNTSAPHFSCRNKKKSISRHIQSATLRSSADIHFPPRSLIVWPKKTMQFCSRSLRLCCFLVTN